MKELIARRLRSYAPALLMLGILILVFSGSSGQFLSVRNFVNILVQTAPMFILAAGLTFVVIGGELDMSGGAVMALVAVACGLLLKRGTPVLLVYAAGLLLGAGIGTLSGLCTACLHISSFILTVAVQIMVRGAAMALSGGRTIYGLPEGFLWPGLGRLGPVPVPLVLLALLYIVFDLVLKRTVFGYRVVAVGEEEEGAEMSGISCARIKVECFALAGAMYALAAMVLTGQLGAVVSSAGEGLEITALSCLAIGGISFSGGQGSLAGTFLGCLIIGVLSNGINMMNLSPYYTTVVRGMVIFGALFMEAVRLLWQRRRRG